MESHGFNWSPPHAVFAEKYPWVPLLLHDRIAIIVYFDQEENYCTLKLI